MARGGIKPLTQGYFKSVGRELESPPAYPSKNNKTTFQRDAIDCADAYPANTSGSSVKERISCMNLKGWY